MFKYKKKIIIILFFFSTTNLTSDIVEDNIKQKQSFEKQKEQYQKLKNNENKEILFYDIQKPHLEKGKTELCIEIKDIKENNITLLLKEEKENILKQYKKGCRSLTELNNLTKELTKLYIDKGYVTSQVYFKAQKIENGVLEVIAVEGKINNILSNDLYIQNAFLFQEGEYLNLRDLETAIEMINRLPSNNATLKIIPAELSGTSDIRIENKTSNRINGTISLDNYGTKKTGKYQGSLNLNIDNLFNLNDQFLLYGNTTDNHNTIENSRGNGFVYSLPIGNRLLNTISYTESSYHQLLKVGITDFKTKGNTNTSTFDIRYKVFHNQNNKLNIGASVSRYDTENFIEKARIDTSSYSLSTKNITIDYLYQQVGFYTFIAFSYSKGTDLFGTHNPTSLDEKFSVRTIDLSIMKQFSNLQYSFNGHYQKSEDSLFGNNQISIGSAYSVRGYNKEGLSGNSGFYIQNEFEKTLSSRLFNTIEQKYFIAYDYGYIKESDDVEQGILASYVAGAKYTKDDISLQMYYAIPIRKKDVSLTNKFFGISFAYKF